MARIDAARTPVPEAARILIERHGRSAVTEASRRYDRAESEATQAFYCRVQDEIDRQLLKAALQRAVRSQEKTA